MNSGSLFKVGPPVKPVFPPRINQTIVICDSDQNRAASMQKNMRNSGFTSVFVEPALDELDMKLATSKASVLLINADSVGTNSGQFLRKVRLFSRNLAVGFITREKKSPLNGGPENFVWITDEDARDSRKLLAIVDLLQAASEGSANKAYAAASHNYAEKQRRRSSHIRY